MSRAFAGMLRLKTIWTAAVAANEYAGGLDVWLGPLLSGDPDDAVFVGYDGDPAGEMQMVVHDQEWRALGQRAQEDHFDIHCCVLTLRGSTDAESFIAAVDRLYGIWRVLAGALRADPSMGMTSPPESAPHWTTSIRNFASYVPTDPSRGVEPRITFDVHVQTRV